MATNTDITEYVQFLDSADIAEAEQVKELILQTLRENKESWLLNAVIDFFLVSHSQRCLSILEAVREPHDKQVFDRLVECIKGHHKLPAITIVGHLVNKPPPWLHKITNHSLMKHLISVMKSEMDVPILVSAVLVVTTLLPIVPVSVQSYIQDILEAFCRLAAFNLKKKPSNVPDIYLLHLHAAIYSLFHRMHGMFPCHLIYYLRSYYTKKDNQGVFDSKIAPMLERVRMHPLLVTASKDKEVSRERWRHKEVHDIIVDCAKLSLDMIEGSKEQSDCPFTDSTMHGAHTDTGKSAVPKDSVEQSFSSGFASGTGQPIIQSPGVLSSLFSPSLSCGLSTPPPGAGPNTSVNILEGQTLSHPGSHLPTARTTPHVHDSPYPTVEPTTPVHSQLVELHPMIPPVPNTSGGTSTTANKRLSAMSLSLSGKGPTTPTASDLVPPSPQKFDFPEPSQQTIRKISFQGQTDEDKETTGGRNENVPVSTESPSNVAKDTALTYDSGTAACCGAGTSNPSTPSKRRRPPPLQSFTSDTFDFGGEVNQMIEPGLDSAEALADLESSPSVPSVNQLPDIIGNLQQGNVVDAAANDEEVQKLTGSCDALEKDDSSSDGCSPPSTAAYTAQSVQAFMKNVKRIRFNSMNVGKLREMSQDTSGDLNPQRSRSNSCPDFDPELNSAESIILRQRSVSGSGSSSSDSSLVVRAKTPTKSASGISFTAEPVIEEEDEVEVPVVQVEKEDEQEKIQNFVTMFPYHHLFPLALPVAPFMKCYNCRLSEDDKKKDKAVDDLNTPLFTSFSPPDLLDRHLKLSCELHSHQLDALENPTKSGPPIRQFGGSLAYPKGLPPADEVKILRGEIQLLHNQVMYERQKRELYAKRNRRLLGKITKATALEEENSAMRDQLKLKENEVTNLHVTVRLQQKQVHDLLQAKGKVEQDKVELQKSLQAEVMNLQSDRRDLQNVVDVKIRENEDIKRDLHNSKAQMFNFVQELTALQEKADFAAELQDQVVRLNKELLLMGELQQKYRQRLVTAATMHNPKPEMQFVIDTYRQDLATTKATLAQKTVNYDALFAYRNQQDELMAKKDALLAEQKRTLENTQAMYKAQLEATEDKYRAQQKITATLSAQVLELMGKLDEARKPEMANVSPGVPIMPETGDEMGATGGGGHSPHSNDSHVDEASECWELSPSDSSIMSRLMKP